MRHLLRILISVVASLTLVAAPTVALASHSPEFQFIVRTDRDVVRAFYSYALPQYDPDVGWVDGDRIGYRCAYTFLSHEGELVGRVTFALVGESGSYTAILSKFFHEGQRFYDGTLNPDAPNQTGTPSDCIQPGPYEPLAGDPGPLPIITFADATDGHPLEIRDYNNPDHPLGEGVQAVIASATPELVVVVLYQDALPVAAVYYELMPGVTAATLESNATPLPSCTRVLGFSQTGGWYRSGFEQVVSDERWELFSASGASINQWADPNSRTWATAVLYSACPSGAPDRVLLTITGTAGSKVANWVAAINQAVITIRSKLPTVGAIILQPVVGGPGHALCYIDGLVVRASFNHPFIDQAITQVVAQGDPMVSAGASPEVASCSDYVDVKGHLSASAYAAVASSLGTFYLGSS